MILCPSHQRKEFRLIARQLHKLVRVYYFCSRLFRSTSYVGAVKKITHSVHKSLSGNILIRNPIRTPLLGIWTNVNARFRLKRGWVSNNLNNFTIVVAFARHATRNKLYPPNFKIDDRVVSAHVSVFTRQKYEGCQ